MTILQVLPALETGGVEQGTIDTALALKAAGHIALVASSGGRKVQTLKEAQIPHITLPLASKNPAVIWRNISRLANIVRDYNVDLIHVRSRAPAWSVWGVSLRLGVPFLTTFHGTYNVQNCIKALYNSVMLRGRGVIAISHHIENHIHRYYQDILNRKKPLMTVIHRGIDEAVFDPAAVTQIRVDTLRQAWGLCPEKPVVMLPGRLTRWKGQIIAIEAFARLCRDNPSVDFQGVLVGSDQGRAAYTTELKALICQRGLEGKVHIVGDCQDMPAAYALSDVVLHTSTDAEAFGRTVVEAQAFGNPVIATDLGGPRETIVANETGWLVPPGDSCELAQKLQAILSMSAEDRNVLAQKCKARVKAEFTKTIMTHKTILFYEKVLRSSSLEP